jgi:hypothetical protein
MTAPERITVHIERIVIVLDGAPVPRCDALVEAFRAELAPLVAAAPAGCLGPARALRRIEAGDAAADLGGDPFAAGQALARAVFDALAPEARRG